MEELTNVVVEENVETEETGTNIGVGTAVTGVCAFTGLLAIAYGAYKGGKWVVNKVKAGKASKVEVLNAAEAKDIEATTVESEN